jgi:hypothetical protein
VIKAIGLVSVLLLVMVLKGLSNPYTRTMSGQTIHSSSRKGVLHNITVLRSNPRSSVIQGTSRNGKTKIFRLDGSNGLLQGERYNTGRIKDGRLSGQ